MKKPNLKHFINLDTLTQENVLYLIDRANFFLETAIAKKEVLNTLSGKVVTTLFFEPSTRTLNSFLVAAKRLSAITLNPNISNSATVKGESLIDTVQSFEAMGTDIFVIRHSDNHTPDFIANELQTKARIINSGDGTNAHPTQALLDFMTIMQHKKNIDTLTLAIIGDIDHSRVARSLVALANKMGVSEVRLVGPESLLQQGVEYSNIQKYHDLSSGVAGADVVIALRIQKERFTEKEHLDIKTYQKDFCITPSIIEKAKSDAILMHPGPLNRNLEITSSVADSTQSVILKQITNGVAMRMALLETLSSEF